jgi:hypothetical protein
MGLLDMIKDLFGSTGVGDLVESAGITEHVEGLTAQVEGLTEVAQAPIEEISGAAEGVTSAIDPLADQL